MIFMEVLRGNANASKMKLNKIQFDDFPITIGRDSTNGIYIDDEEVSRFHAKIKVRGSIYILEDLNSKNGTFLNGDRVLNSIIQNGDRIIVGNSEFLFSYSEEIGFAKEIDDFDVVFDEVQGIRGPITLEESTQNFISTSIKIIPLIFDYKISAREVKKFLELQKNIIAASNFDEAIHILLRSIQNLLPKLSRGAFLVWSQNQRKLIPIVVKQFEKIAKPFTLNQTSFAEAMARKHGLILTEEGKGKKSKMQFTRIVLPILQHSETLAIVHLELDSYTCEEAEKEGKILTSFLTTCSSIFDSFILRREMDTLLLAMIETMVATIEAKDTYTMGHSERVCKYSLAIADELRLNKETKKLLLISSLCHDIGKIGIPDSILKKASLLSSEEYDEMKLHPVIGAKIISNLPHSQKFLSGIKYHHEKWDGTGYPEGLIGENIPFFGRIVAVADVFDAMVSGRSYSGFLDENDAIDKMEREGDLFDPQILKALVRAWENGFITQRTSTINQKIKHQK